MATIVTEQTSVMMPAASANRVDAVGPVSAKSTANELWEQHKYGIRSRYRLQLIWEKLLLHFDGSGDAQYAEIFHGTRVEIPRLLSEFRKTENLLRPIGENAIAHHTSQDLRFFAESSADRAARDRAIVDTIFANDLAYRQDLNGNAAEALYLALCAGFCPLHGYWRDDIPYDPHEAIAPAGADDDIQSPLMPPPPGFIDLWVGNPFGTVFNPGATKNDVRWCSYERVVNADAFREAFSHIKGVDKLEGTTRLASAAIYQRIARFWLGGGLGVHGLPVVNEAGHDAGEEVITLVCREEINSHDDRTLRIIAVPGYVDSRYQRGGSPLLVAEQPLPAGTFSCSNIYSHNRGDDIHGKPWLEDLDQLQVDFNITISKEWEQIQKMAEAPIVAPGGAIGDDMMDLGGYNVVEVEPALANWRPRVMEWPQAVLIALSQKADKTAQRMFQIGGYQAVSRGESLGSRTPYRAILALQQADLTVHGPVNARFQRSIVDFMGKMWKQAKMYMTAPQLMTITGDDYAHLVEPWIDASKLSEQPPKYTLVNAFGSSSLLRAEEVKTLMQLRGGDGQPFLTTEEGRRLYPDRMLFGAGFTDYRAVQRRHAKTVASAAIALAADYREQTGLQETDPAHPWVQKAAQDVFYALEERYQRLRDDDLTAHLSAYSEVTQDDSADPIARGALMIRQGTYYTWQADMAAQQMQAAVQQAMAGGAVRSTMNPREDLNRTEVGREMAAPETAGMGT